MSDSNSESNSDSNNSNNSNSNSDDLSSNKSRDNSDDKSNNSKSKRTANLTKFDTKKLVFSTAVEVNLNSKENAKSGNTGKSLAGISFGIPKPHLSKQQNLQGIKNINNQLDLMWNNFSSKVPAKPNTKPKEVYYCNNEVDNANKNVDVYNKFFKNKQDKLQIGNIIKNTPQTIFDKQYCFEISPNTDYFLKKDQEQKKLKQLENEIKLIKEANEKMKQNIKNDQIINDKKVKASKEKEKTNKIAKENIKEKKETIKSKEVNLENNFDYTRFKSNPKASNISRIRTVQDLYQNSSAIERKQPIIYNSNTEFNYTTNKMANEKKSFESTYYNNQKFYTRKDYLNENENDIDFDKCKQLYFKILDNSKLEYKTKQSILNNTKPKNINHAMNILLNN